MTPFSIIITRHVIYELTSSGKTNTQNLLLLYYCCWLLATGSLEFGTWDCGKYSRSDSIVLFMIRKHRFKYLLSHSIFMLCSILNKVQSILKHERRVDGVAYRRLHWNNRFMKRILGFNVTWCSKTNHRRRRYVGYGFLSTERLQPLQTMMFIRQMVVKVVIRKEWNLLMKWLGFYWFELGKPIIGVMKRNSITYSMSHQTCFSIPFWCFES